MRFSDPRHYQPHTAKYTHKHTHTHFVTPVAIYTCLIDSGFMTSGCMLSKRIPPRRKTTRRAPFVGADSSHLKTPPKSTPRRKPPPRRKNNPPRRKTTPPTKKNTPPRRKTIPRTDSEWARPGIRTPFLVVPGVRKPNSEWAQRGSGTPIGSICCHKTPFRMGSAGCRDPFGLA